jgi:hypothetical protein
MYGPVVLVRDDQPALTLNTAGIDKRIEAGKGPLEFRFPGQPSSTMVPFYRMEYQQPYAMYFDLNT